MFQISSTNRSKSRDSHIADYYVTPIQSVKDALIAFTLTENIDWKQSYILDPCAGGDANRPMSYPTAITELYGISWIGTIDIREDSLATTKADYLTLDLEHNPDIVISNPPFALACEFIEKALKDVKDNGWVIMLLRLNFFESKQRKEFFDTYMPRYAFVHHRRMSFTENGVTDSVAYMHCVWQKGNYPEFCNLKVI